MFNRILPSRFYFFAACVAVFAVAFAMAVLNGSSIPWWLIAVVSGALSLIGLIDVLQKKQAVRRNYPILAHIRFLLESIRPEIRQYFLETDTEQIPYSRQQRTIIYERAKNELNKRPFGTQNDVYRTDWG